MNITQAQKIKKQFDINHGWDTSRASNVFVHFIEELGEIGRYISYEEGYKSEASGNSPNIDQRALQREFAQVFMLFLQLANHYDIDLNKAFEREYEVMKKRFKADEQKNK